MYVKDEILKKKFIPMKQHTCGVSKYLINNIIEGKSSSQLAYYIIITDLYQ